MHRALEHCGAAGSGVVLAVWYAGTARQKRGAKAVDVYRTLNKSERAALGA
jgi:hypothetical protein